MQSTPAACITTTELTKRYGRLTAFEGLTTSIPHGGLTALVGPNGAGKSTLLKLCLGFERPTSGSIDVLGVNPVKDRAAAIANIGYVPQRSALYRDVSIHDHLQMAAAVRPAFDIPHAKQRVTDLGISLAARPRELSGGQQAQVTLAIALACMSPILLLDEPLASLDPLARRGFLEVVREAVRARGVSVVLSSHVLSEIEDVADHILVLGNGAVLFADAVPSALERHRTVEAADVHSAVLIGRFPGRRGATFSLVDAEAGIGRVPTLEEVVLGYLAFDQSADDDGAMARDTE